MGILSIIPGFEAIREVGGINAVNTHTMIVTRYLCRFYSMLTSSESKLRALRHSNGSPLLRIYGNHENPAGLQGPIVTVNVRRRFVRRASQWTQAARWCRFRRWKKRLRGMESTLFFGLVAS